MVTKMIDPRALGSITTGTLLLAEFGAVHEAITHVLGREVWTHELPSVADEASAAVLRQFPEMPTNIGGSWRKTAAEITRKFGVAVAVEKGCTSRTYGPITTAVAALAKSHGER